MSFLSEIEKIRSSDFVLGVLSIILLVSPGFLTLYYFHRDFFLIIDSFKLALLAVSFIAPFLTINTILLMIFLLRPYSKDGRDDWFPGLVLALLLSNVMFYIMLLLAIWWDWNLLYYVIALIVLQVIVLVMFIIGDHVVIGGKTNKKK